jgi:hypothetical protein
MKGGAKLAPSSGYWKPGKNPFGEPVKSFSVSGYGNPVARPTTKYNSNIIKLEANIVEKENIMYGKTGKDRKIEELRQKLRNPKLSEIQQTGMYKQLEELKDSRNLKIEEAKKGKSLEVMKANLEALQVKQAKKLAKQKPITNAAAKEIMAKTLGIWRI